MSNQLIILGTVIPQQHDLFNLKDLHQLSGGKKTHEPYQFIRLDQTQELIKTIEAEGYTAVKTYRGTQGGTYACKEIVIAYAAWISPQFHLVVLRAFLNQLENSQKENLQKMQENQPLKPLAGTPTESETAVLLKIANYANQYKQFCEMAVIQPAKISWSNIKLNNGKKGITIVFTPDLEADILQAQRILEKYANI